MSVVKAGCRQCGYHGNAEGKAFAIKCPVCGRRSLEPRRSFGPAWGMAAFAISAINFLVLVVVLVLILRMNGAATRSVPTSGKRHGKPPAINPEDVSPAVDSVAQAGPDSGVATEPSQGTGRDADSTISREQWQNESAHLKERMNESYPVPYVGESVMLRKGNGRVHRGVFVGLTNNAVILEEKEGRIFVPLEELDRGTRLRCDPTFRRQLLEYQVRRRLEKEDESE